MAKSCISNLQTAGLRETCMQHGLLFQPGTLKINHIAANNESTYMLLFVQETQIGKKAFVMEKQAGNSNIFCSDM